MSHLGLRHTLVYVNLGICHTWVYVTLLILLLKHAREITRSKVINVFVSLSSHCFPFHHVLHRVINDEHL